MKKVISKEDLMKLGYKEHTARSLIVQAKQYLCYNMKKPFYNNRRLGLVPREVIETIIGVSLDDKE